MKAFVSPMKACEGAPSSVKPLKSIGSVIDEGVKALSAIHLGDYHGLGFHSMMNYKTLSVRHSELTLIQDK